MKKEPIKIGEVVRTNNPEILRDGMLVKVIDTNNEDMICIRFNDGQEEWRLFKDVKKISN